MGKSERASQPTLEPGRPFRACVTVVDPGLFMAMQFPHTIDFGTLAPTDAPNAHHTPFQSIFLPKPAVLRQTGARTLTRLSHQSADADWSCVWTAGSRLEIIQNASEQRLHSQVASCNVSCSAATRHYYTHIMPGRHKSQNHDTWHTLVAIYCHKQPYPLVAC